MKVKAAEGLLVPKEDDHRQYIGSEEAVDIDPTPYYIRRMATGELLEVDESVAVATSAKARKS